MLIWTLTENIKIVLKLDEEYHTVFLSSNFAHVQSALMKTITKQIARADRPNQGT
jgi:hypothetical protein